MIVPVKNFTGKYHQPDYQLVILMGLILIIGLVVLGSASVVTGLSKFGDAYFFIKHQLLYGLLPGLFFFFLFWKLDYHWLKKIAVLGLVLTTIILALVFVPGLGMSRGESIRWIKILGFSFQPAEVAKLTFLIYLVAWLESRGKKIKNWTEGFLPFLICFGAIAILVVFQKDLGTLMVIFATMAIVYFLAGGRILHLIVLFCSALAGVFVLIKLEPYRMSRLITFINPTIDPQGISYHIQQALIAIGSGGWLGLGLGHSRQKYLYLPEPYADSIFAVMAEELGFFLTMLVIVLFFYFVYRGLKMAAKAPDSFGQLLAAGIISLFLCQMAINIGALLHLFPLTGIPLPLVSYGGTAMVVFLAAFGILINISKQTRE